MVVMKDSWNETARQVHSIGNLAFSRVQGSLLFVTYTIIQSIISSEMQVELKKNTAYT